MARRLDATAAEVHRNFGRLQKAGFVKKDPNGNYELTLRKDNLHTDSHAQVHDEK